MHFIISLLRGHAGDVGGAGSVEGAGGGEGAGHEGGAGELISEFLTSDQVFSRMMFFCS